jgi:hypothetical protein
MIRVSSAFVMKFNVAMEKLQEDSVSKNTELCSLCDGPWPEGAEKCPDTECKGKSHYTNYERPPIPRKLAVEEFLDALKYDLAEVLMPSVVEGSEISFDKSKKVLDTKSAEEHTPRAG